MFTFPLDNTDFDFVANHELSFRGNFTELYCLSKQFDHIALKRSTINGDKNSIKYLYMNKWNLFRIINKIGSDIYYFVNHT